MLNFQRLGMGIVICALFVALTLHQPAITMAQDPSDAAICEQITRDTLTAIGVNCAETTTGSVCYASANIAGNFTPPLRENDFSEPGDILNVQAIDGLTLDSLDMDEALWGAAVLDLQANLPVGFPGSGARVFGFGGIALENAVNAEEHFAGLEEPVATETSADTELRALVAEEQGEAERIQEISAGTEVFADAVNSSGDWVRVIADERAGWIPAAAVKDIDLDELPIYDATRRTPFQSFYFRSLDNGMCGNASGSLLIQGAEDTPVDLFINDVPVRIESTIFLRTRIDVTTGQFVMDLFTLFGVARLFPDSDSEVIIPAGFFVSLSFNYTPGDFGIIDPTNTPPSILPSSLLPLSPALLDGLRFLLDLPAGIFVYTFAFPVITQPSGVGGVIGQIRFEDPRAVEAAARFCSAGTLPADICATLGF
jgi:hypothetical protein